MQKAVILNTCRKLESY